MNSGFDHQGDFGEEDCDYYCEDLQFEADIAVDKFYRDMFRRKRIIAFVRNALIGAGVLSAGALYLNSKNESNAREFSCVVSEEMGDPAEIKIIKNLDTIYFEILLNSSEKKKMQEEINTFLIADKGVVNLDYDWLDNIFDESAYKDEVKVENYSGEMNYSDYEMKRYGKTGGRGFLWADREGDVLLVRQDDFLTERIRKVTGSNIVFSYQGKDISLPYLMVTPIMSPSGDLIAVKYVPLVDFNEGEGYFAVNGLSRVSSSEKLIGMVGKLRRLVQSVEKNEIDLEKQIAWKDCKYGNMLPVDDLKKKLADSVVQLSWVDAYCSGFVYDDRTLVTAKHCLRDSRKVDKVVYYAPRLSVIDVGSSVQSTAVDESEDLGLAVFESPVFAVVPKLAVADELIEGQVEEPYFIYNFNGRDTARTLVMGREIGNAWNMDTYVLSSMQSFYDFVPNDFNQVTFNGGIIKGNSGGPIVNCNAEVVSVVGTVDGFGPNVTVEIIESLQNKALGGNQ